jgi:hypothetical protein
MATSEPKTRPTTASVDDFIDAFPDERVRDDCREVVALMSKHSKEPPVMWGPAIIGFGSKPIKYSSGKELEWPVIAFSPRKTNLTLYLEERFSKKEELLGRLGKHSVSKACLYIKRLSDIEVEVLEALIKESVKATLGRK